LKGFVPIYRLTRQGGLLLERFEYEAEGLPPLITNEALQGAELRACGGERLLEAAGAGDVVFADPPPVGGYSPCGKSQGGRWDTEMLITATAR
jgi:hypothetical protein